MDAAPTPPPASLADAQDLRLVLVTAPPGQAATDLARGMVEEGLAACVNLVPGLRSVYRWRGALLDEPETLLLVKAPAGKLEALARHVAERHPHENPEFLAFTPEVGLAPYLAWVRGAPEDPGPR
jgi:periplasmic divalent cation tolerance protein